MVDLNHARVSRRAATQADVPFLLELRRRTMDTHLHTSGVVQSEEEHLRRVLSRFECAEIILFAGQPQGLLKIARDGKSWELVQIQINVELQGQGLGAWLIQGIIAEAQHVSAKLRLSVLKGNPACRLYKRLGFSVVSENTHAFEMEIGGA